MKLGIVLFNLGGPDGLDAVEPFLRNLFSDPAIISLPGIMRKPLARFIARRRAPLARSIYQHMGGRSPIVEETQRQARALEAALARPGRRPPLSLQEDSRRPRESPPSRPRRSAGSSGQERDLSLGRASE